MQTFQVGDILRVTAGPLRGRLVVVTHKDRVFDSTVKDDWIIKIRPLNCPHGFRFYHQDWLEPAEPLVAELVKRNLNDSHI